MGKVRLGKDVAGELARTDSRWVLGVDQQQARGNELRILNLQHRTDKGAQGE